MKLAKVTHYRCDEFDSASYVWAPDDMTEDEFDAACERAQTAYLKYQADFQAEIKPIDPGYAPAYEKYPDKTVAEIKKQFDEEKLKFRAYDLARSKSQAKFATFLKDEGFQLFWEVELELSHIVDWGHRHGQNLEYRESFPKDFPVIDDDDDD